VTAQEKSHTLNGHDLLRTAATRQVTREQANLDPLQSAALPLTGFLSKQRTQIGVDTEAVTFTFFLLYIGTAQGTQCDRDPFPCREAFGRGQLSGMVSGPSQ